MEIHVIFPANSCSSAFSARRLSPKTRTVIENIVVSDAMWSMIGYLRLF